MDIKLTKHGKIIIAVLALLLVISTAQNVLFYTKYNDALDLLTYSATTIYDDNPQFAKIKELLEAKLLSVDKNVETDSVLGDLLDRGERLGFERDYIRAEIYNFVFLD